MEIYCLGDIETAQKRDFQGLYGLAKNGFIKGFTGVDTPFEPPENADLILDTLRLSPAQSAEKVVAFLKLHGV
jgi:adenylylsulfate kinase-like enzyme